MNEIFTNLEWQNWTKAAIYLGAGFIIATFISNFIGKVLSKHTSAHYTQIIRRIFYYGILALSVVLALTALQLDMKVLGIATVVTLGLGFASQTAVSNVISGLFLIFEQPFVVGDEVEFGDVKGEILAIDLLSIKIVTYDNTLVRIPNEMLLKNPCTTLTKFATRRLETLIRIDANDDLYKVQAVLFAMAADNKNIVQSPAPQMLFEEFGESAIMYKLAVWVNTESYRSMKNKLPFEIQKAFRENNLKIPTMHLVLDKS